MFIVRPIIPLNVPMGTSNSFSIDVSQQIIARVNFWETSQRSESGTRGVGGTLRV